MRRGRRVNADGVSFIYRKRPFGNLPSRFAVLVPASVDKRAVGRNRRKRLIRQSVRLALPHLAPGWDGVFVARRGLGNTLAAVDSAVRTTLSSAGILQSESGIRNHGIME